LKVTRGDEARGSASLPGPELACPFFVNKAWLIGGPRPECPDQTRKKIGEMWNQRGDLPTNFSPHLEKEASTILSIDKR